MRAQLIELTPESRTRSRKAWWLNRPFTSAWQSSNVPSTAMRMHVVVVGGGHHPPLHVGDAAVRKQDEQIGPLAAAERLDRGAAGVARGRDHDGGALAARRQRVIHQPRQQLHGDVLEGERRAVEQLEQEGVAPNCASGTTAGCRNVP